MDLVVHVHIFAKPPALLKRKAVTYYMKPDPFIGYERSSLYDRINALHHSDVSGKHKIHCCLTGSFRRGYTGKQLIRKLRDMNKLFILNKKLIAKVFFEHPR